MSHRRTNHLTRLLFSSLVVLLAASVIGPAKALAAPFDLTTATIAEINEAFDTGLLDSEKLVELCLARIEAYDQKGPELNAVITINPEARARARALDAERLERGRRSPLHGIPVVVKDNFDTADMPTTAGSFLLDGSVPPDDAFIIKKLRDAGAIILAKLNMSEFASGGPMSSIGGPIRNPHDLTRTPSGSSGGTGVAIAAAYAPVGLGTDTGGSVRGPSAANGIVGLKTTHGLLSRNGIVPLGLSFDTAGPMARRVSDLAAVLGVMTGIDPDDASTRKSEGRFETDYTRFLDAGALNGARIGVARDFMGRDSDIDWIIEAALKTLEAQGATLVDLDLPNWLLSTRGELYTVIRHREFRAQIPEYLETLEPGYPRTLAELIERSMQLTSQAPEGFVPNPSRWNLMKREEESGELSDYEYVAVKEHALPLIRSMIEGLMDEDELDAIVYPTASRRPSRTDIDPSPNPRPSGLPASATNIANLTGFPDLIVPAGFTGNGLPVSLSFLGRAFSEPRLLALGYAFEQASRAHRIPVHTPALPGETIGH